MIIVNGKEMPWHEGMTISEVLKELDDPYPYVAVRIDGRFVTRPDFNHYELADGANIFLIPLISGG
ncbi:MAG: sulfur carrier protein ThiS [Deltaproteobacteria bacterium]|nr:sulfur carrier protein ThiS [Deltaproteobacteria bacterium]MBW1961238.1 sulfur carrier protein ThiS [Deltaproteobacteria bacterium]MBW1995111.1 sulfur carrier protein ThiS [Deltaproteobacteria bacterium]MBW2151683.1 sulfur carrier protein ThiS [Deltaproteobacteria bacterium]